MTDVQYCSECIFFNNETHEDYLCGDYRIWSEISCDMGNEMDDTLIGFVPCDKPCKDYEEKTWW